LPTPRHTEESDLSLIAEAIRRRIWVVAICLVAAILGAVALTLSAEKRYAATAALLLRPSSTVEPQRSVDTNLQLLSLPAIAHRTAENIPGLRGGDVTGAIDATQQGDSDIIRLTATTSDPRLAAEIANGYAEEFLVFREGAGRERLQTSQVEIVERATPDDNPVSPNPVRNVIFGALIGLVLGLGLALLLEQLDRRVKRQDDLPEVTGLPLLATIPKRKSFDEEHLGRDPLSPAETEIFRMLRANLRYFNVGSDIRSVLVTSAEPGEGKTLISLGLALGAATSGERVLLIEADMRDPVLARILRITREDGLSRVLAEGNEDLTAAVTTLDIEGFAEGLESTKLDVIPAGAVPPNPTALIESGGMRNLLAAAEAEYDFVVVDTPPILAVADAIPLISEVSGVLAVSGLGVSTRNAATDLAEQLERLQAPTLGLVANFATNTGRSYDGYGYGRPPEAPLIKPRESSPPSEQANGDTAQVETPPAGSRGNAAPGQ
jgi:polysaccharide biosynthesis transport protein